MEYEVLGAYSLTSSGFPGIKQIPYPYSGATVAPCFIQRAASLVSFASTAWYNEWFMCLIFSRYASIVFCIPIIPMGLVRLWIVLVPVTMVTPIQFLGRCRCWENKKVSRESWFDFSGYFVLYSIPYQNQTQYYTFFFFEKNSLHSVRCFLLRFSIASWCLFSSFSSNIFSSIRILYKASVCSSFIFFEVTSFVQFSFSSVSSASVFLMSSRSSFCMSTFEFPVLFHDKILWNQFVRIFISSWIKSIPPLYTKMPFSEK